MNQSIILQLSGNIEFNEYANKVHISNKQSHEEPEDFVVTGWGTLSVSEFLDMFA